MNLVKSKIINLLKNQQYLSAEKEIRLELVNNPKSFDLNKILAVTLLWQEKYNSAISFFNICYEINRQDYDVNINLALLFNKIQDYKLSLEFSRNAKNIDPNRPEAYHNLADSYLNISELVKAEKNILKSINLRGGLETLEIFNFKDTLNIYTDILFIKGDEKKFNEVCVGLLNKGVFLGDIFRKLFRSDKNLISKKCLDNMENVLKEIDSNKNYVDRNLTKANIYSCLAEYNQKIDKAISEKYYLKSNKLISELQRFSVYDRQEHTKEIINFFENSEISIPSKNLPAELGDGLIFIIGMPRSGTTLIESIISTADNCIAGGEKIFFVNQCRPMIMRYKNGNFNFEELLGLGQRYLDLIDIQRQNKKFFIDKLPENYLYYKFIKNSLPLAKFIHVHRDPWDNAISLFKQYYVKQISYSSSFFGIAVEYANYEHITEKWKENKDHDILDVNYKDLVSDTNNTANKIWKFCDLPGKYDESKRANYFAQTASKYQVREKIYLSSLNKNDFTEFKENFLQNLDNQRKYWSNI
tara:strand:- start:912 stop:2495 length:1584 start_codon:yes stop_codon:yes gene_type:complete